MTLLTATILNIILWLSVFTYFMPASTDKQISIDDRVVLEHKLNNDGV